MTPSSVDTEHHNTDLRQTHYAEAEQVLRASYNATPLLMGTAELLADGDLLHLYDNPATSKFFESASGRTSGHTTRMLGVHDDTIAF